MKTLILILLVSIIACTKEVNQPQAKSLTTYLQYSLKNVQIDSIGNYYITVQTSSNGFKMFYNIKREKITISISTLPYFYEEIVGGVSQDRYVLQLTPNYPIYKWVN